MKLESLLTNSPRRHAPLRLEKLNSYAPGGLLFVGAFNIINMNANEFYALRKRVAELEDKLQQLLDCVNHNEVKVENRLSGLESKVGYQGYTPVDMNKAEYR